MTNRFINKENFPPISFIIALILLCILGIAINKHNIKIANEEREKQRIAHTDLIKQNEDKMNFIGDSFDRLEYELANEERQELTEKEKEFYYTKATETIGGAGEFGRISPYPNRNELILKFPRNYENIYKAHNLIIVKDTFEYLNAKGEFEKYSFRCCLSEEGEIKEASYGPIVE
ncbi:hypothetical protein [Thermotalea metallivorans]|uniref:Uncharacterized protein n=1 Tax=Thermotalea metallivorans TaxID=520762 RepID=A0A140L1G5_9FIRM|nr:hypothetical protein [Thermotalea metallivorans]KXG74390.1 hypothetical protein AN619_23730 [Thermotalea metallivorans]